MIRSEAASGARWHAPASLVLSAILAAACAREHRETQAEAQPACRVLASATIAEPGRYCLDRDLVASAAGGIAIAADHVDLDLQGHQVRRLGSDPDEDEGSGISVRNRANVRIHHGRVSGFDFGIDIFDSRDVVVEQVHVRKANLIGIRVAGSSGVELLRNSISDPGRKALEEAGAYAIGIHIRGRDVRVSENRISGLVRRPDVDGVGEGVAILVATGARSVRVERNHITVDRPAMADTIGVWLASDTESVVAANSFLNVERGIVGLENVALIEENTLLIEPPDSRGQAKSFGIYARDADPASAIRENEIRGYSRPLVTSSEVQPNLGRGNRVDGTSVVCVPEVRNGRLRCDIRSGGRFLE